MSTLRDARDTIGKIPAGLAYVSDAIPGYSRHRHGSGFIYRRPDGGRLTDDAQLARIRSLAIPPAYTRVWICPLARGHLQATGRDARGRKQYRYHPEWRRARDIRKFDRLLAFATALPRIRATVEKDLVLPEMGGVPRRSVLAGIVRLLDTTLIRIGNDEYARSNGSFGVTTLRSRHVEVIGSRLKFCFRGKSGVLNESAIDDRPVARIVRRCQALPGQQLFKYLDDAGATHPVSSADVNDYVREACGGDFTAKDFRTWHGSVHALALADQSRDEATGRQRNRATEVLREVAGRLGNTVAVCRKAYVHPRVLDVLLGTLDLRSQSARPVPRRTGLTLNERRFMRFLTTTPGEPVARGRRHSPNRRDPRH